MKAFDIDQGLPETRPPSVRSSSYSKSDGDVSVSKSVTPLQIVVVLLGVLNLVLLIIVSVLAFSDASETTTSTTCTSDMVRESKNVKDLTPEEKQELVRAFKLMKSSSSSYDLSSTFNAEIYAENNQPTNSWDYFTAVHYEAAIPASQVHATYQFLREFVEHNIHL